MVPLLKGLPGVGQGSGMHGVGVDIASGEGGREEEEEIPIKEDSFDWVMHTKHRGRNRHLQMAVRKKNIG